MLTRLSEMLRYVTEAFAAIFSPADPYPAVGVQPYDGDPYSQWVEAP